MISDRIEHQLMLIVENTNNRKLKWRPISEFMNVANVDEELYQKVQMLEVNEYIDFHKDQSFYVIKDEMVLALLTYDATSAIDGTFSHECELVGEVNRGGYLMNIPPYIDGGIETIKDAIINYWKEKSDDFGSSLPEIIELLQTFSE